MSSAKKGKSNKNRTVLYIVLSVTLLLTITAAIKIYEDVFAGNINLEENKKDYIFVYTNKSFAENAYPVANCGIYSAILIALL